MTEKDAVKLMGVQEDRIWVLVISATMPDALLRRLDAQFNQEEVNLCSTS